jgi:hypothetical protein
MFSFRLVLELVKFAGGGIPLHLPVPLVIFERVQQRLQLASLLWRKLVNRSLDFSNRTHAKNLNSKRKNVNEAKTKMNFHRKLNRKKFQE